MTHGWPRSDFRITIRRLRALALQHRREHGVFPSARSGPSPLPGVSWMALDMALRQGSHGLAGGQGGLPKFLRQQFPPAQVAASLRLAKSRAVAAGTRRRGQHTGTRSTG